MADLLAEFSDAHALADAVRQLRDAGLTELETFTPFEVCEVQESLPLRRPRLPLACLVGGAVGAGAAFLVQWWLNAWNYPLNVGGRPLDSFPAFVPIAFEGAILGGALGTVIAFLAYCGLPRLWHPVFEVEGFERASVDRFFLRISRRDPRYDQALVLRLLRASGSLQLHEVEAP